VVKAERFNHTDVEGLRVGRGAKINNTCILYRLGGTVIDTGPPNQWKQVRRFLQERDILQVLLTHHHEDHSGNGAHIHQHTGAPVKVHPSGVGCLREGFPLRLYQRIFWGQPKAFEAQAAAEEIELSEGLRLRMVHTPGHSHDSACFLEPGRGWLFSGDLFVASKPRYLRGDEDPNQQIESLERILSLDFKTVFCAHRGVLEEGRSDLGRRLDYLVTMRENVRRLRREGLPVGEITRRLLGREDWMTWMTGFHFSKRNLVTAFLDLRPSADIAG